MYDTQSLMLCFRSSNIHLMRFLSGFTVHFSMSGSNCFSVGSDTKPGRLWPPGETNLHFLISHPHSDGDTYSSLNKMMVIVKMNMMIVRVMVTLVVVMSMMMIMCYCCQWRRWVFHRLTEAQQIRRLYQVDGRGPGKQQQDRWNHIRWNECDWTSGLSSTHRPPTVSGLHCEGQQRRIQTLQAIYWRVFGGECVFGLLCIWI